MEFEEKVSIGQAETEVNNWLANKKVLPSRMLVLEEQRVIATVVEGVQLGYVSFNEDGTITQKLIEPFGTVTELKYPARITAEERNKTLQSLKVNTPTGQITAMVKKLTGEMDSNLIKMESGDKNIAEAIALFFM